MWGHSFIVTRDTEHHENSSNQAYDRGDIRRHCRGAHHTQNTQIELFERLDFCRFFACCARVCKTERVFMYLCLLWLIRPITHAAAHERTHLEVHPLVLQTGCFFQFKTLALHLCSNFRLASVEHGAFIYAPSIPCSVSSS